MGTSCGSLRGDGDLRSLLGGERGEESSRRLLRSSPSDSITRARRNTGVSYR